MSAPKFFLRYYPPGIVLEMPTESGETEVRSIDLLDLSEQ